MKLIAVKSIDQLYGLLEEGVQDYFILLNGGLRSNKTLYDADDGGIMVLNHIDDTETRIEDTNIYEAMKKGAFFAEIDTDEQ